MHMPHVRILENILCCRMKETLNQLPEQKNLLLKSKVTGEPWAF